MNALLIILLTLALSAFFSGMEIAFVSANKLRIELDKKQGLFPSAIIDVFSNNPSQYLATMLIGNNIALVVYGVVMAQILEGPLSLVLPNDGIVLLVQTILSTLLILITAEFLPKALFRINPNKTLKMFTIPVYTFYILFYPIARITSSLSRLVIRWVFGVKISDDQNVTFGKIDLDHLVNETMPNDDENAEMEHDVKIFQNALDFSKIKLRECVIPRTEIVAVSIDDSVELLKHKFNETGYSKILVYQNSIDNIIGFAHSITLFQNPNSIRSMIRKIPIVPETMPANKLLELFISNKKNLALVVDEFGGTSGIVTLEDIIEEIIGDIQDEHDKIIFEHRQINEHEFQLSGRLEIDSLNEKYNLNLPVSDDYETVAGLILAHHGSIPKINDNVNIGSFKFKILKASTTRIELVHLKID